MGFGKIMELSTKYKTLLLNRRINKPLRLAHFMTQIHHESRLKPISENLNYSAKGLRQTFPKYFTEEQSIIYQRKPQMIANRVYANRMGNGDEASGDGWKFRGRGFLQNTGKNQYILLSKETGIDFVNNPDLLLDEANAMIAALWFWNRSNLNFWADKDDLDTISDLINIGQKTIKKGDANGFADRKELLEKYKKTYAI